MTIPHFRPIAPVFSLYLPTALGSPFRELLPESIIQSALEAEEIKYRQRLFDPFPDLVCSWLSQVIRYRPGRNAVSQR